MKKKVLLFGTVNLRQGFHAEGEWSCSVVVDFITVYFTGVGKEERSRDHQPGRMLMLAWSIMLMVVCAHAVCPSGFGRPPPAPH